MKDLSRHIEYLLCEHDSVVIPSIGAFVTEELPARYYTEENIYLPPIRSVRLDTSITENDGKLENCLIHLHRITRNVAHKWIDEYIDTINQSLMDSGIMDMGTIGRLVYIDNKISFEVCEAGVNTPEWYGLDSFHMPKLPAYAHKRNIQKDHTHFTIRLRKTTVHRAMTAAAMLIVALTVILPNYGTFTHNDLKARLTSVESLTTIFRNNPLPISFSNSVEEMNTSCLLETSTPATIVATEVSDRTTVDANNEIAAITDTVEQAAILVETIQEVAPIEDLEVQAEVTTETVPEEIMETPAEEIHTTPLEAKGYCVVMASAITHKGADHLINKLSKEGFQNAVKCTENGMLRVVLTGYANEKDARADLASVRSVDTLYSGSWIKFF